MASAFVHYGATGDCARRDRKMDPLGYLIIDLISGALVVATVFLLSRRRPATGDLLAKIDLLERAHERGERMWREEMTRNREENANAAKSQREELTGSLENVRGIVDLRLQELQKDNAQQIERMRATVDEKQIGRASCRERV